MRKSYTCSVCAALFVFFFALSTVLYSIFIHEGDHAILFMICAALLFATQNLIHVFIGRTKLQHSLLWHISAILLFDAVWCGLFLFHYMSQLVPNQIKLGLMLHVVGFSLVHVAVFAKYLLTTHLLSKEASAEAVQHTEPM